MLQFGIFAKYWQPGHVKTRLAARVGSRQAGALYHCFVETLMERFATTADLRVLAYAPADAQHHFARLAGVSWLLEPQGEGDLGMRMRRYFENGLARGADAVLLIGSDSPTLPETLVELAYQRLTKCSVVLGPADDGGYYLIGAAGQVPTIFADVDWSTPHVMQQTREQLQRSGCRWSELPLWYDVDQLADLQRLNDELQAAQQPPAWCSRLRRQVEQALNDV